MNKFEEMNYNSDAIISADIDSYLLSQGYTKNENEFNKFYYREDNFTTRVTIKRKSIYFYREDGGFYVSDDYIEIDEDKIQDLEVFKIYINKIFEENFR